MTLRPPGAHGSILADPDADGWCRVASRSRRQQGMRRVHIDVAHLFAGRPHVWFVAVRDIRRDEEILLRYGAHSRTILACRHETSPSLC